MAERMCNTFEMLHEQRDAQQPRVVAKHA
jgi:hypothetical protein